MNWFNRSFVGWIVVIIVLTIAAYKVGVEPVWIAISALALIGIAIITSAPQSKPR